MKLQWSRGAGRDLKVRSEGLGPSVTTDHTVALGITLLRWSSVSPSTKDCTKSFLRSP